MGTPSHPCVFPQKVKIKLAVFAIMKHWLNYLFFSVPVEATDAPCKTWFWRDEHRGRIPGSLTPVLQCGMEHRLQQSETWPVPHFRWSSCLAAPGLFSQLSQEENLTFGMHFLEMIVHCCLFLDQMMSNHIWSRMQKIWIEAQVLSQMHNRFWHDSSWCRYILANFQANQVGYV